ncbi:hypothetical protein DACRYDRAFT_24735 [Dacryopinax primogenitus]|uniref:Saccharopine dehydrogenase [NADP(+), L-glutamate-forming] n=1 Tax=Dacryopinax primogenitus (strain DJM 731) TaxID=1858805 RepID=M5FRH7_DACPD|nr:uncharacterized protein DACRYDRAFT_24735 [Dacryopinax primogenitus]EJT98283.1 hypothetical protein DACRYDRAFT_24735 [Dacryopinax primogenitus]
MTLKVDRILHTEQSQYQDVLVFQSEKHGNVLVLDSVIQCTERDEFSYQEMIAHLPLASHPDPQRVLVIGGGDGGVVREVLKHVSVQEVVLCDIDEAVIRVSKQFLPHMSALLSDPRVTVHIGDGFKFLAEKVSQFDVIITDSSDPVGPAESLFQKPYFQLLHDALRLGGHISTQAENPWLHLPLISELTATVKQIFSTAEYAYASVPTYPSGGIGFLVASKSPGRDVKLPLRDVPHCRYWNKAVHSAAFVVPEFARASIEEGKDLLPDLTPAPTQGKTRKVLLLGNGYVAGPAAEYILRDPRNELTIGCRTLATAQALCANLSRATPVSVDATSPASLDPLVASHDLVVSLIPYIHHADVIRSACRGKTNVVTTSYVSDAMRALEPEIKKAGIVVMNEIGLDPGIDHLYAIKTIDEVHAKGGKVTGFLSYCGGLPAPECCDNPLGYKFSWSSRGVLLALLNSAKYYFEGKLVQIPGRDLMSYAKPYFITPAFAYVAYPNRDSSVFREFYHIPEAQSVIRGTLRYQGFPQFIKALVECGFLDQSEKDYLGRSAAPLPWNEVTMRALGAKGSSEEDLIKQINVACEFESETERQRIISGFRWIGLFSDEKVTPRGTLLDTLCAALEKKMPYEKGERDLVILQHKFFVEWADGKTDIITSTLEDYGDPHGWSSMATLVGIPCGIAVQLVLDGVLATPGILAPYSKEICDPIREKLEQEGIRLIEKTM